MSEEKKTEKSEKKNIEKQAEEMAEKVLALVEAKADKKAKETKKEKKVESKEIVDKNEVDKMDKVERTGRFINALIKDDQVQMKVLSEGVNADGGFLVPDYWHDQIVEEMRDDSVIRSRATVIEPCPKQLNINQLASRPIVFWRGEKAIKDTSTATYAQISLTPYSLACIVVMTKELATDAETGLPRSMIDHVTKLVATAIYEEEDDRFAVGTGVGQPTGIDNYSATVGRITATPANVLAADSLIEAFFKLGAKYRKNAVWLMNSITLTKARQLKDTQNRYLFIPDPSAEIAGTILGRPVLEQNHLPLDHIWLIDLRGYWIGIREGISVMQSEEATITGVGNLFERNEIAIRVEERVDGELADLNSASVVTGTN